MTRFWWRTTLGAVTVVVTVAAAVVTNIVTGENGSGWWPFLAALAACLVALSVAASLLDRNETAETGRETTPRHQRVTGDHDGAGVATRTEKEVVMGLLGRHHVQVISIVAVMAVSLTGLALYLTRDRGSASPGDVITGASTAPPSSSSSAPSSSPNPRESGVRIAADGRVTFTLGMQQGHAYDIDVAPGESPYKNVGSEERDRGDDARDLYLSGKSSVPGKWDLYVPEPPQRSVKSDSLTVSADGATDPNCRRAASAGATNRLTMPGNAAVGAFACLRTTAGRHATVELLSLPDQPGDDLLVKVTLT